MLLKKSGFFILFMICHPLLFSQAIDTLFKNQWNEIDSLIIKANLPKSALEKITILSAEAANKGMSAHQVKALMYRLGIEKHITESDINQTIATLQSECNHATDPAINAILHVMIARELRQYLNNQRWQIYNRSRTKDLIKEDIQTWSIDDFLVGINTHFSRALEASEILKQISISCIDPIIVKGELSNLRPTLFDLIAQMALDFYKTGEANNSRSVQQISIQEPAALGNYLEFAHTTIHVSDTGASVGKAVILFQELIRFHVSDSSKNVLVDIDIDRLNWIKQQSHSIDKTKRWKASMSWLTLPSNQCKMAAYAWLALAEQCIQDAQQYNAYQDSLYRWKYVEAEQFIRQALTIYDSTNPAFLALSYQLNIIAQKRIKSTIEKVNLPNQPFRALIEYRNTDTVFVRLLKINLNEYVAGNERGKNWIRNFCALHPMQEWIQPLPGTEDRQTHTAEIKINSLPSGEYLLLASSSKNFNDSLDEISLQSFQVSKIALIQKANDFFVMDRESGKPLKKAKVHIYRKDWRHYQPEIAWEINDTRDTDENGHFVFNSSKGNDMFRFLIEYGKDYLDIQDRIWLERTFDENGSMTDQDFEKKNLHLNFFTDRSIYRPGQTVYFKSIATTIDRISKNSKILAGKTLEIFLHDAANKIIDSLRLTTNEYGSVQGKFVIPQQVLTGNFSLRTSSKSGYFGLQPFQVEAYKKPTYNIQFHKMQRAYQINDSIQISGFVKAFAGNAVDAASLVFHIQRITRPVDYNNNYRGFGYIPSLEIASGKLTTDSAGKFSITFLALGDDRQDLYADKIFDFQIEATVTDRNGESKTGRTTISCSQKLLKLDLLHAPLINAAKDEKIWVSCSSINNELQQTTVRVRIASLILPDRAIRAREWQRPDQFVMSRENYLQSFPYDEYDHESDRASMPVKDIVFENEMQTNTSKPQELVVPKLLLQAGIYQLMASTIDANGNKVERISYFEVFDSEKGRMIPFKTDLAYHSSQPIEPGGSDTIYTGTDVRDQFVIRQILRQHNRNELQFLHRKKGLQTSYIPIHESDQGGLNIDEIFIFQNRVYSYRLSTSIPWTNKNLHISYSSFRDKTEPGSAEKWTIHIEGKQKDKASAELLTAMYDASLDELQNHHWNDPFWWRNYFSNSQWKLPGNFGVQESERNYDRESGFSPSISKFSYDQLSENFRDLQRAQGGAYSAYNNLYDDYYYVKKYDVTGSLSLMPAPNERLNEVVIVGNNHQQAKNNTIQIRGNSAPVYKEEESYDKVFTAAENNLPDRDKKQVVQDELIQVRRNFNETAFFFPQLMADSNGNYQFSFTMPDAITKWKWISFAHTKELAYGMQTAEISTYKTLMLHANAPRFLREGDKIELSANIANLSDQELTGQISLELIDAVTLYPVDGWFQNVFPSQYFTIPAKQSSVVKFPIQIPFSFNKPLIWRLKASSGKFSDGEEIILPVLSNRQLVTETLPMLVKNDSTHQFNFNRLKDQQSSSASTQSLTIEYTSNPIWYAVQALPFLQQETNESAEQIFQHFYANQLASYIVSKNPALKHFFELAKKDTATWKSKLEQNETLKQILIAETPWVLDAANETASIKQLSDLFDAASIEKSSQQLLDRLQSLQLSNGAFCWFKGGWEDRHMTNLILTGIGRLKRLGAISPDISIRLKPLLIKALQFSDTKLNDDYQWLINQKIALNQHLNAGGQIQYLYMRSLFRDIGNQAPTAYHYYLNNARQFRHQLDVRSQSMLGLVLLSLHENKLVQESIYPSIIENAIRDQQGMHWKNNQFYFWNDSPVETASMVIELASEMSFGMKNESVEQAIDEIKTWLLLNKQTHRWGTSITTANACYALLMNGSDWINDQKTTLIQLGNLQINSSEEKTTTGSGYLVKRIEGAQVQPEMGNIRITQQGNTGSKHPSRPSWGAVYWQYLEELDKINATAGPLLVSKQLMLETSTDKGSQQIALKDKSEIKIGDKVIIRLTIHAERDLDYVHLKDLRSANMEPVTMQSGYKWQDGVGYYESNTDIGRNFFIGHLSKGRYVFEYPVFITHAGNFSAGIASIQCLYAPEFISHSEGFRINAGE